MYALSVGYFSKWMKLSVLSLLQVLCEDKEGQQGHHTKCSVGRRTWNLFDLPNSQDMEQSKKENNLTQYLFLFPYSEQLKTTFIL